MSVVSEWVTPQMLTTVAALPGIVMAFVQLFKDDVLAWFKAKGKNFKVEYLVYIVSVVFFNLGVLLQGAWDWRVPILTIIAGPIITFAAMQLHLLPRKEGEARGKLEAATQAAVSGI